MLALNRLAALSRVAVIAGLMAGGLSVAVVAPAGADPTPLPASLLSLSPAAILAASIAGAHLQHSVAVTQVQHLDGKTSTQAAASFEKGGEQVLHWASGAHADIRLVGGVVYVKDDALGIKTMFGVNDPKYANKWIEVTSTVSIFAELSSGITFPALLAELPPSGKLTKSKIETVAGKKVIAIAGKPNQTAGKILGSEVFYVSTSAPFLPVAMAGRYVVGGKTLSLMLTMSSWKKRFVIAKPTSYVSILKTNL